MPDKPFELNAIWGQIIGADPFNDVIRNATSDYLNGQQTNAISNLAQQAINDAQQAAQQGGSGSSDTQQGGSDGTPTLQGGIYIVGGEQNLQQSLNNLEQAMAEQADSNFQGLLNDFSTNPIIQNILNDGKDSQYLSIFSSEIAKQLADSYRNSYETAQNLPNLQSKEDYQQAYANILDSLNNAASICSDSLSALETGNFAERLSDTGKSVFKAASSLVNRINLFLNAFNVSAKEETLAKLKSDFNSKYPGVNIDDGIEIAKYSTLVGLTQEVIYADPKIRDIDPKLVDKYVTDGLIELKWAKRSLWASIGTLLTDIHVSAYGEGLAAAGLIKASTLATIAGYIAIGGIAVGMFQNAAKANDKAHYLNGVHLGEQPYLLTYIEQLVGLDYGTVRWLSNPFRALYDVKNALNPQDAGNISSGEQLVFNDTETDNTLLNVQNNYSINAKTGNKKISNVGDNVKIDVGAGGNNNNITNLGDNVEINSDNDNNNISNTGSNTTITLNDGINNIDNSGDNVTINIKGNKRNYTGNRGKFVVIHSDDCANDIENFGSNVTVNTGSGADFIINYGDLSTINAGSGQNVIFNSYGSNVLINTDQDDDYISVKEGSERVTINSGNGSDAVINNGTKSLINLGVGNDFVYNDSLGSDATINGLDGDDTLENRAANVSINAGAGDNRIVNDGLAVTMTGGTGVDVIANAGNAALINAAGGNNSIGNAGDTVSISAGNGSDIIINEGNFVTINVAGGNNGITNKGSATSIIVGSGTNSINNYATNVTVSGGTGNDEILNGASNVTLNGNRGSDTFVNYFTMQVDDNYYVTATLYDGNNVLINGGDDGDYIENEGGKATLNGDAGSDTIINYGIFIVDKDRNHLGYSATDAGHLIDGGSGDDYIYNMNSNATIYGGQGNDSIELHSTALNNVIKYNRRYWDGDDVIWGANSTTTIKISGSDFTVNNSGNDKIVDVNGSKITLKNAASISGLTVVKEDDKLIRGTDGADNIDNTFGGSMTIQAFGGNDTIENLMSDNVSIDAGSGNDRISNESSHNVSITAGDGDDYIENYDSGNTFIDLGDGADSVTDYNGSKILGGAGSDSITIILGGGFKVGVCSIDGGDDDDTISNDGSNVTINGGAGDDKIFNSGDYSYVNGGTGVDAVENNAQNVTIDGGAGNDSISLGSNAKNNLIAYNPDDGSDTIRGFNETSTLKVDGNYSAQISGSDVIVKVGNNSILLIGASTLEAVNILGTDVSAPAWTLNGTTATYATWNKIFATVSGVKSSSGLAIDTTNKKVTVSNSSLGTGNVTVSSGYTLKVGNDVTQSTTTPEGWSLNGTTATYKTAYTSAGYKLRVCW